MVCWLFYPICMKEERLKAFLYMITGNNPYLCFHDTKGITFIWMSVHLLHILVMSSVQWFHLLSLLSSQLTTKPTTSLSSSLLLVFHFSEIAKFCYFGCSLQ